MIYANSVGIQLIVQVTRAGNASRWTQMGRQAHATRAFVHLFLRSSVRAFLLSDPGRPTIHRPDHIGDLIGVDPLDDTGINISHLEQRRKLWMASTPSQKIT